MKDSRKKQSFKFAPFRLCRKSAVLLWLCACLLLFAGCRGDNPQTRNDIRTREITDDLGRIVKIPARVERAVSLAPNLTESVFAVDAGSRLVGVTSFCNYPAEAQNIPKVGDTISPNMETIIALKPQIVFVSTASQIETFTKTLEQQNIAVFVTNPNGLNGVLNNLKQFGEIFGTETQAEELVANLKKRISAVESRTQNKLVKVFVQISKEPLFTIGKDSFLTEIVRRAGGESVTANVPTAYPKLSKETASALNPAAIILSDSEDNREPNDVFAGSDALKNGKVFHVNADIISRPAPRIVDALEQMAKDLN
ncbi:MAG TPA: cobalamin-binding protein [Pyrinomonadaceae bacterium]